ncbi:hypothetical protein HDE_13986 [Halotydeus destructor]|nr:hypothetical protein HDE_13986 [Halotydeus destructor]
MKTLIFQILVLGIMSCEVMTRDFVRHGNLEYMTIETIDGMTKSKCLLACPEFGASLIEPRTKAENDFLFRRFSDAFINVYYGKTNTSRWETWRFGSDGAPTSHLAWSHHSYCRGSKPGYVVHLSRDGWCSEKQEIAKKCHCQKRHVKAENNPL